MDEAPELFSPSAGDCPATSNLAIPLRVREDSGYLSTSLSSTQCSVFSDGDDLCNNVHTFMEVDEGDTSLSEQQTDELTRSSEQETLALPTVWQSTPACRKLCLSVHQEFAFVTPLPVKPSHFKNNIPVSTPSAFSSSLVNSPLPCLAGVKHVDILTYLSEHAIKPPLSMILDLLSPADLSQLRLVSKSWQTMLLNSPLHMQLWRNFVRKRNQNKENSKLNYQKAEEDEPVFHPAFFRSQLKEIHNVRKEVLKQPARSPPVSPSKMHSSRFLKAGQKLSKGEKQFKCPHCNHPSQCDPKRGGVFCTNKRMCGFRSCVECRGPYHENTSCPKTTPVTPTKPRNRIIKPGSKISKRNLQRLLI